MPAQIPDGFVRVRHADVDGEAVLAETALPFLPGWTPVTDLTSDRTIVEVLADVGDDPNAAAAALTVEQDRTKPRKTLVDALTGIIDTNTEI